MKTILTALAMILFASNAFAQPCAKCPQNVHVNVDMDLTETNQYLEAVNQGTWQSNNLIGQLLYEQKRSNEVQEAQGAKLIRLQKASNGIAIWNASMNTIGAAAEVGQFFQNQKIIRSLRKQPQQTNIYRYHSSTNTTTNNYGTNGGGTVNLPGHNDNQHDGPPPTGNRGSQNGQGAQGTQGRQQSNSSVFFQRL